MDVAWGATLMDVVDRHPAAPAWALASLFSIGFVLWLGIAWTGYARRYTAAGWHKGGDQLIEITLVRDDEQNLACAADVVIEGLHCGYRADLRPFATPQPDDRKILSPYNTVKGELFLGSGLWSSPALRRPLPGSRFTVVCNYHVLGIVRSAALRWTPKGRFDPVKQSLAVGSLTDCAIPE